MDPCLILLVSSIFGGVVHGEYTSPNTSDDDIKDSTTNFQDCDASKMPTMDEFNMKKFSGVWYEISKTAPGYIDFHSGAWKIIVSNTTRESNKFLFVGKDSYDRCIRPTSGVIRSWDSNPGILTLKYRTYSTDVSEHIRVLFTDYVSVAVLYACAHTDSETNSCHPAGLFASIWMRKQRIGKEVYENAAKILQRACIHKSKLQIRNLKDPCKIHDFGSRKWSFPVPNYCYVPMDPGKCQAKFERFFYDSKTKQCKMFIFSGCNGSYNNFAALRDCENQCMDFTNKPTCESEAPCALLCPPCCNGDENGCVKCTCGSEEGYCLESLDDCPEECTLRKIKDDCYNCVCLGPKMTDIETGSGETISESPAVDHCLKNPNDCSKEECKLEMKREGCYQCNCGMESTFFGLDNTESKGEDQLTTRETEHIGRNKWIIPAIVAGVIVIVLIVSIVIISLRRRKARTSVKNNLRCSYAIVRPRKV